jgi:hypothetical protein
LRLRVLIVASLEMRPYQGSLTFRGAIFICFSPRLSGRLL